MMPPPMTDRVSSSDSQQVAAGVDPAVGAQEQLHHAYLLGLQLMVTTRLGPAVVGDWMFRLFRRQHLEKFLSSFDKLGLTGLPHAVACARYHVLSNDIGGVAVEYVEENDRKAWVRFRYPRWMYDGPTICGVPVEVSRGFLNGWYAHNGVSLGNPRLGFVCVSEDMTGEFGFCGYFREFDEPLAEHERLRFARDERPPPFDPARQPAPPSAQWPADRLAKAARNYAIEYIRNGIVELAKVAGVAAVREHAGLAARLIGMQYRRQTAALIGAADGGPADAAGYLAKMLAGMGDEIALLPAADDGSVTVVQRGARIVRGLPADDARLLFDCWRELWVGAVRSHAAMPELEVRASDGGEAAAAGERRWTIRSARR